MKKRKLKMNYRSLTGVMPSEKNGRSNTFESSLERDFIYLLEYDKFVSHYFEQPLTIYYNDLNDNKRHYTPDFLVFYRGSKRPVLFEIKYKEDLTLNGIDYEDRFKAAKEYCEDQGYEFRVFTEDDIRTEVLENAKFLSSYVLGDYNESYMHLIIEKMSDLSVTTPKELLFVCTDNKSLHPEILHTIWYMVSQEILSFDTMFKLTMKTELWLNNEYL